METNQPRQAHARIAAPIGAALIFVCLVCSACGAATSATSTSNSPTAQPTITNTPSGPAKVNGPYLGGTESNFQAAFGAPTLNASQSRQYQTTIAGTHVLVIATLGPGDVTGTGCASCGSPPQTRA